MRFVVRLLITALALQTAVVLVPGIAWVGGAGAMLGVVLIFTLVNALLKPILTLLSCPLILLTMGLFLLVVNAVLLIVTARLSQHFGFGFTVSGFGAAFVGGIIVSIANAALTTLMVGERRHDRRSR